LLLVHAWYKTIEVVDGLITDPSMKLNLFLVVNAIVIERLHVW
jgi:hypothetical protein